MTRPNARSIKPLVRSRKWPLAVLVAGLALLAATGASAAYLRESISGERFNLAPTEDGTRFRCLGAGAHRLFTFKVYAVAYCVEEGKADEAMGNWVRTRYPSAKGRDLASALEDDQGFFDMLASLPGDKLMVVRFLRDIPGDRLARSFHSSLARLMPESDAGRVAAVMGASSVSAGQTAMLYSRGSDLVMRLGNERRVVQNAPIVTERIWRVWLGGDSPTPNLKRSIASEAATTR